MPRRWGREGLYMATKEDNERKKRILMERDGNICAWCNEPLIEPTEIDHKKPRAKGGGNEMENLQVLHRHCNKKKRDSWDDAPAKGRSWRLGRWILIFGAIAFVVWLVFS